MAGCFLEKMIGKKLGMLLEIVDENVSSKWKKSPFFQQFEEKMGITAGDALIFVHLYIFCEKNTKLFLKKKITSSTIYSQKD